jgi:hypothetical protein
MGEVTRKPIAHSFSLFLFLFCLPVTGESKISKGNGKFLFRILLDLGDKLKLKNRGELAVD